MNKVIEEKIINILRSGDIVNNAISLPLNEKLDILKEVRNRKNYYYELLVEELSKAHKKLISKEETDYIASHLADFKDYDFTRICFTYEMDFSPAFDNIFIQAYKQTGDVSYIPFISDPVGYVEDDFYAWDFLNDEQLEKVLLSGKAKYRRDYLIKCFSNDYYKEKYLTKLKESYERANIIESFESDELKIKNLNKVNADDRGNVIASFKSDELKKRYLNVFTKNKGSIINSFESDEDKIAYFNHFSLSLSADEKGEIIARLSSLDNVKKYIRLLKTQKELSSFLSTFNINKDRDFYLRLTTLITKEELLDSIFWKVKDDKEAGLYILNRINSPKVLGDICSYIFYDDDPFNGDYLDYIIPKLNDSQINKYIKSNFEEVNPKFLLFCNDRNLILEALKHNEHLNTKYSEEYKKLFGLVASSYRLNVDHLIKLAQITDCSILSMVENDNIKDAINLGEEDFNNYLRIFDKKNYDMDITSMNNIATSLLQRSFSINFPGLIQVFATTIHDIEDGKIDDAYEKVSTVYNAVSDKHGIGLDDLFNLLLKKDANAMTIYNEMTKEFLKLERNEYVNRNLTSALLESSDYIYDKNSLLQFIFKNIPSASILNQINKYKKRYKNNGLINNEELLQSLISFRKNPSGKLTDEMKKSMGEFNDLLYEIYTDYINNKNFDMITGVKFSYVIEAVSGKELVELMANINVKKLKELVFSDRELFEELLSHLDKYDMLGWSDRFKSLSQRADIETDSNIVASIINNFKMISRVKKEREEIDKKTFTIANELDLASCLDSDANIYALLLGEENYRLIRRNPGPNASPSSKMTRLKESIECLKRMHEKKYITVPSVNENVKLSSGNTINILVGNTNDPINLTYGERTGACMRIGGAGSTLFDFCLTNENGFHISFNDPATGAFVSRVSCFRNGNTLFLNQLRDSVNSKYSNEDIIEACKIMGQKLIELTKDSKYPIENVVASNGYALRKQKTVELDINNVQKGLPKFYTDVSSSGVVVVATSNNGELLPVKPNPNGALRYQIGRGIVRKYDLEKANSATKHIEALDMLYEGYELDDISTSDIDLSYAYVGEDWYVGRTISGEIVKYIQKNSLNKEAASKEIEIYEEMVKSNAYGGILL